MLTDQDSKFLLEHGEVVIVASKNNIPAIILTTTNIYPGEASLMYDEKDSTVSRREIIAAKVALKQPYVTDALTAIKMSFLQFIYYFNAAVLPLELVLTLPVPEYPPKVAYNPLKTMIGNPRFLKKFIEEASAETLAVVEAAHPYPIVEEVVTRYSRNTPLLKALMRKYHTGLAKMILQSMPRIPLEVLKLYIKHNGNNPEVAGLLLEAAIRCDENIDKIRYLLTVPGVNVNKALYDQPVVGPDSTSPFAWDEHREGFDLKKGDNVSIHLSLAISRQRRDVAELLLEHGAQLPIVWRDGLPTLILTSSCNLNEVYGFISDLLYQYFNSVAAANNVDEATWDCLNDDAESNVGGDVEPAIKEDVVVESGENSEYLSDGVITDDDGPAAERTAAATDKVVVPTRSKKEILSAIARMQNVLAKQTGIAQDAAEALQSLVFESLDYEEPESFFMRALPTLLATYPEISIILTEAASALNINVSDQVETMAILCSDHQKVHYLVQMLKKVKAVSQAQEKSGWVLPGNINIGEGDTYAVQSSMHNALYFYIDPELAEQYSEYLHRDALAGIRMIQHDSYDVDGIKHLGGIIELKILKAGNTRFTAKAMYRNKDGALLIIFNCAMDHKEVGRHVRGKISIVDCQSDAAQSSSDDAAAVAGPMDSTLPMATVGDVETNAAILGIPVVHGEIPGNGLVIIDSDGEQGRIYPAGARVEKQDVQDGTPSCSDNALFTAMKLIALGKRPFLLKRGDHVVVALHSEEDIGEILDQLDSVDLQEYPALWSQYLEVMTGCPSSESIISDFSTFSWLQGELSIVKTAVSSWGTNTLTDYINNILDTLSELDFTNPKMHAYAGEVQVMLVSILANIGTQTSGGLPAPGRGPGFDPDDSVPGGGSDPKGKYNNFEVVSDNSTNVTGFVHAAGNTDSVQM